jgi:dTDP-4-dehydrorhamnose reductase
MGAALSNEWRVLVLGGSGFVGSRIIRTWDPLRVEATYFTRPIERAVRFDVANERLSDLGLLRGRGFTHAILAQGMTKLKDCAVTPATSASINVHGTIAAIDELLDAGVHPIFLSSDGVFDGARSLRTEDDEPHPILRYGEQKLEVEAHLAKAPAPWTILRLAKVVASFPHPRNLLYQWLMQLVRSESIMCARDQVLSPIDIDDVLHALHFVIETNATGLFNVSGSETFSRLNLLYTLINHVPRSIRCQAVIQPCSIMDINAVEKLPQDCSLLNSKFKLASGLSPRSMDRVCADLCDAVFAESKALA